MTLSQVWNKRPRSTRFIRLRLFSVPVLLLLFSMAISRPTFLSDRNFECLRSRNHQLTGREWFCRAPRVIYCPCWLREIRFNELRLRRTGCDKTTNCKRSETTNSENCSKSWMPSLSSRFRIKKHSETLWIRRIYGQRNFRFRWFLQTVNTAINSFRCS